jgi:cytochrome c peroxidase
MSPAARRGYTVFFGKGRCGTCHPAPYFGSDDLGPAGTPDRDASGKLVKGTDPGFGGFRAVSLRNIGATAPYMHNGVFRTLAEVIDFYDQGGARGLGLDAHNQDEDVRPLGLTAEDKADLLEFLHALDQQVPLDTKPRSVPSGLPPGGKH